MSYVTVRSVSTDEIEEKKSRFIGCLVPIADFDSTLAKLKEDHRKANHHVTAFRKMLANGQVQEIGKDDGEPSGTSGMPVLKTMIGANLMDAAIIVTRYFGGTKLGTGGLARAYSGAAQEVIRISKLEPWVQIEQCDMNICFDQVPLCEQLIQSSSIKVLERKYTETGCHFFLEGPAEHLSALRQDLANPNGF